ncbi:alpha/beta fold hydrolase [Promicromonospora sp. NPDC050262]|uniref:alpha/beta fold hydrolase n=1 Tax=Promicromonospora sp. NPDC050262 TaxID=3155036 RepID=UPI00340E0B40
MSQHPNRDTQRGGFMLVHGGGHDARCWAPLTGHLDGPFLAADLPGCGTRPADLSQVTLDDLVLAAVADLDDFDTAEKVVLIGHSMAGITIPAVAAGPSTHSGYGPSTWVETGTRLVESVLNAPKNRSGSINPTEKPVSVLELLISYACPPGGIVLDVFAGSGSTAVAARHTGRSAVLIEKREEQCESTARRLAQGVLDLGDSLQPRH